MMKMRIDSIFCLLCVAYTVTNLVLHKLSVGRGVDPLGQKQEDDVSSPQQDLKYPASNYLTMNYTDEKNEFMFWNWNQTYGEHCRKRK